ncbi:Holliday junction branch migration DNA helicase RuvB [Candidatus Falkowbacteria bacterium]|jgi:holliday junction DNA helicase RuvB|nr:Holliday junction branch migration DNA helicase RuvB [Candidatus Falkowbacteria bacterium]MBT4433559.1 Holliday junction branch migration DNA helicase RuvB [Candidatus Falkowbacteria bacterium]
MNQADDNRITSSQGKEEDKTFDVSLRPKKLSDYVGQKKIKENLEIFMEAARRRNEPIEHVLLYGPPGLGKTTLAHIIASETGSSIKITSGPAIEKTGDLAAILTNLQEGDILFIDEIHRLNKTIEEILYPAMEDYALDIIIGKGPSARTLRLELPKFTIIGATTKVGMLSHPLRDRFGNIYRLNFYEHEDIEKIILRNSKILNVTIEETATKEVAKRSRRTPRIANRLLKRVRDFAEVKADGIVTKNICDDSLNALEVDELGLDEIDRRILKTIIEKFDGGPIGLNTLAAATFEETDTIEEMYEPYLMQLGFLHRTPRGRIATEDAYRHLGIDPPDTLI